MTEKEVQIHIDKCDGVPPSRKAAAVSTQKSIINPSLQISKPITRPEKLAHPHFPGLKDHQLRKKLTDLGISAGGTRTAQELRLKEWVLLWNSNCDNKIPKGKIELRRELDIWERTQGDRASTSNISHATGLQIKDKDFDGKAWAAQHSDTFGDLIAQARSKAAAKRATAEKGEETGPSLLPAASTPSLHPNLKLSPFPSIEPPPRTPLRARPDPAPPYTLPEQQVSSTTYNVNGRFFQESDIDGSIPPPSSQYEGLPQAMNGDSGLDSDTSTIRALQP
jgi:E3 ubiquitin-protein ligase RAD18